MTLKKATQSEVQKLAESLLGPALEPVKESFNKELESLTEEIAAVRGQVSAIDAAVQRAASTQAVEEIALRVRAGQRALQAAIAQFEGALEQRGVQIAALREEALEVGRDSVRRALSSSDGLREVSTEVSAHSEQIQALQNTVSNVQKATERVLERMTDLENLSVRNHSEALKEVAAGLTEAVATVARSRVNGE